MRRGFTLSEMALVLSITGAVLGIALPKLGTLRDSIAVEHAAWQIVSAHQRARVVAITRSRPALLTVAQGTLSIRLQGAGAAMWDNGGPAALGVSLAGPPRTLIFSPVGITMGLSNATFALSRGAAARSVVVSRLGRVRIVR